jgi:hypothetical protein
MLNKPRKGLVPSMLDAAVSTVVTVSAGAEHTYNPGPQ